MLSAAEAGTTTRFPPLKIELRLTHTSFPTLLALANFVCIWVNAGIAGSFRVEIVSYERGIPSWEVTIAADPEKLEATFVELEQFGRALYQLNVAEARSE